MNKITYLIANYNTAQYIADCIESLNEQSVEHWQAIICDDASSDNSIDVINSTLNNKKLTEKITLIKNSKNLGYIATLKRLINEADTNIIGILDSDDALMPEATAEVLSIYDAHENYGFVYTDMQSYDEQLKIKYLHNNYCSMKPNDKTSLLTGTVSHLKTFKKSDYFKTPGLDESILYAEDRDLVYMMEEVTDFYFINKRLYKYRIRPDSQTSGDKLITGFHSHVNARKKALKRREISGIDLLVHNFINANSIVPPITRWKNLKMKLFYKYLPKDHASKNLVRFKL
jgi:glycosyltransferase involved in cell wall biosynthesis